MPLYDPDDLTSIWNVSADEFDPQSFKYGMGEIFEEPPETPNICKICPYDLKAWIATWPILFMLWALWIVILRVLLHQYSGWLGIVMSLLVTILFGGVCIRCTVGFTPQTLIFTKGLSVCTHIIGCEPIGIRRYISRERLQGFSLVYDAGTTKSGGSSTYLYLNWMGVGLPIQVGRYKKHEVAVARAKYISERTGIPVLWPKVYYVVQSPKSKQKGNIRSSF